MVRSNSDADIDVYLLMVRILLLLETRNIFTIYLYLQFLSAELCSNIKFLHLATTDLRENILVNYFYCNVAVKSDQWPVSRVLFTRHVGAGSWYWHTFIKVTTSQNKLKILTTQNILQFSYEANLNKYNKFFLYFFKFKPPEWD